MGKGLPRSHAASLNTAVNVITIPFNSAGGVGVFEVDGASGVGFGTLVAGGFPEGNILFLGAACNLQFAGSGADAGLVDTWAGDFGAGTTPASDGTISAGDVDILPSTALAAATAEVSPTTEARSIDAANAHIFDNTDGSLEINLNLLIDDANISADGVPITVTGFISLAYCVLGNA
jgi:hypothetical protein